MKEINYREGKQSRYLDRGHYGRKVVWWSVMALMAPFGLLQIACMKLADLLDVLGKPVSRVNVWAHPCLYRKRGESNEDYSRRVGKPKITGKPPVAPEVKLSPQWRDRLREDLNYDK